MKQELILCDCSSSEHQMIIRYFEEDFDGEVYVDIHLTKKPFWYRLKHGLKYIFGYQCKYGAFDEIILGTKHIKSLEEVIKHIKMAELVKKYD